MKSSEHAVVGTAVSMIGVRLFGQELSVAQKLGLWLYGVVLSVVIDLDHFVLGRYYLGDWSMLNEAISDPARAFTDPAWLFTDVDMETERLLSHAIIGGLLSLGLFVLTPLLGAFTALVLYAHGLCDLLRDTNTL